AILTCAGFCRFYNYLNSNSDNLIRRVAALSKNGLLLTNPRVVFVSGAHLNTAPYLGHGKVRVQQFSEKSEWSWLWGAKSRNAGMRRAGSFANYGVSAIAIRAMNGWQNSFRRNCSLSITRRRSRGTPRRRENSYRCPATLRCSAATIAISS